MQLKRIVYAFSFLIFFCGSSQENSFQTKAYTTDRINSEIQIDGKLDDDAWNQVEWGGDFVGHMPDFNVEPFQQTQFKILYDAKFLYVGIRAFDTEPEKIVKRMSRRDGFDGDFVEINIDSYGDKRTAFSFSASVSGVKGDEYVSNNGDNWDSTWDPIWYLRTSIDDQGWIAEFKIPLSQLRFANKENHTWGIQFTRRIFRTEERSTWQPVDPNAPGWVHLFGELNGLKGIKPQKQLEIQPYVLASYEKYPKEEENPFRDSGEEMKGNFGLDAKIGLTSDITLDLTVNPDFGQVDADPSAVNLSAFQLFFQERRPFFLEGSSLLTFGTSGGPNNLFYSRRIGGRPVGRLPDDVSYSDFPRQTQILGAAKLTGKNAKGFSWGVLESFTNKEVIDVVDTAGVRRQEQVEPYTNYLVGRVQQDFDGGKTVVGAMITNMNRIDNEGYNLRIAHNNAQSAGVDINHNFRDRKYGFEARFAMSRVEGSQEALYRTQTSSVRFFQRPNNSYQEVDSARTQLIGSAASISFGKRSGNFRWTAGSNYRSPGLALNDIGFLRVTDNINNWLWASYRVNKVTNLFRSQRYNMYMEQNMDFGRVTTGKGMNMNMNLEFNNYWGFGQGVWIGGRRVSNADLRGGPSITYPGNVNYWYWIGSNSRKKVRVSLNNWFNWGRNNSRKSSGVSLNVNIRPLDAMQVSFSPSINWNRDELQYISQAEFNSDDRYVLGRVEQRTYSMSMRMNYNVTPNLTLEFWGQPFIASGQYSQFKRVHEPNAEDYSQRFKLYENNEIVFNENDDRYEVYESNENSEDYGFDNPDFNIVQFRSNFVMRWEYIPGSTLFLAWANSGSYFDNSRQNDFSDLSSKLSGLTATNTFLIKYTYRFIL
ncbi:DUF5916 domain-containing protein [Ekhidna sp. To15]|uniref:DUF5916 domain-containing protein n=1 Tax=Ekhidna sp. To15 TaxID=3395267 RepID=UPI003F528D54